MAASRSRVTPPFTNVDPETAEEFRRRGSDPLDIDRCMENFLSALYANLPRAPVRPAASLAFCREDDDEDGGGADRISGLHDALLHDIVSRLPVKDAARTAALAARWREVWRSAPLVLVDAHLSANTPDVAAAVSRVLAAHLGPFRCVHLLRSRMGHQADLGPWLRRLAAGGIQELVLVNRPGRATCPSPPRSSTPPPPSPPLHRRLEVPRHRRPPRRLLPPPPRARPLLRPSGERGHRRRRRQEPCPGDPQHPSQHRLRIVSQSLRCVQVCHSVTLTESIAVVNAPRPERLILSEHSRHAHDDRLCTRVTIGNAPKLRLFGYLDPWKHALEIHDTVITAGIGARASMILTIVKVLSLKVRFGVHDDINMVPAFLRCFPNVEALHITSAKCDRPAGNGMPAHKFWKTKAGPILSVLFRIKVMTFSEFRGEQYELSFLQYFFESARMLKYATIMMANQEFTSLSVNEMFSSLKNLNRTKWATGFDLVIGGSHGPEGGPLWTFQRGANFCDEDPFEPLKIATGPASTDQEKPQAGKLQAQHRN